MMLGVKVFTTTRSRDRDLLGDTITQWIRAHGHYTLLDKAVLQSSDSAFHCLSIVLVFRYSE